MKFNYLTDIGQIRQSNEDAVYISKNKHGQTLAIVADGMGGHKAGDVASKVVIAKIGKEWSTTEKIISAPMAKKWLSDRIKDVNNHILSYASSDESLSGMGTTVVIALCFDSITVIANVGDSRAYIMFNDELIQITTDQTLVNELIFQGEINEVEAKFHPQKNVLMQAVGTSKRLKIDFIEIDSTYDKLLLCSDGLTNMVDNNTIAKILFENPLESVANALVDAANKNGGQDNITVAVLEVGE